MKKSNKEINATDSQRDREFIIRQIKEAIPSFLHISVKKMTIIKTYSSSG